MEYDYDNGYYTSNVNNIRRIRIKKVVDITILIILIITVCVSVITGLILIFIGAKPENDTSKLYRIGTILIMTGSFCGGCCITGWCLKDTKGVEYIGGGSM